jgi:transmembrane sensor
MTEPFRFAREALDRSEGAWDDARVEGLLARTRRAVEHRRRQRVVGLSIAASLVLVAGVASLLAARGIFGERQELTNGIAAADVAPTASAAGWSLEFGRSRVAVLRNDTDVRALPAEGDRAGFELVAGAVRVEATSLHVLVAGQRLLADQARFELVRDGEGFELRVQEGVVRFGDRELGAGTHFVFDPGAVPAVGKAPPERKPEPAIESPAELDAAPTERPRPRGADGKAKPKWRTLVQSREWAEAYTEMKRADPKSVRSSVDALMAAADAARFGGHPDEAPSYLEEVVDDHSRHPMAPLAAFTLGRVCLEQLGAAERAARAFAKARSLAPAGALAADALAREVEAWAKAGERDKARARAQEYLDAHPEGRRAAAVRRHGGIQAP